MDPFQYAILAAAIILGIVGFAVTAMRGPEEVPRVLPSRCTVSEDPNGRISAVVGSIAVQTPVQTAAATCWINTDGGTGWERLED